MLYTEVLNAVMNVKKMATNTIPDLRSREKLNGLSGHAMGKSTHMIGS